MVASMDVLSDLLRNLRLSGGLLFFSDYRVPWAVACPPSELIAPALVPGAERLVIFHIVIEGRCVGWRGQDPVIALEAGDVMMLPWGDPHGLADAPDRDPEEIVKLLPMPPWQEPPFLQHGGDGTLTRVLCGFLHCPEIGMTPFTSSLPPIVHLRGSGRLGGLLLPVQQLMVEEARTRRPGHSGVLSRLTEALFIEAMRCCISDDDCNASLAALKDPLIEKALSALHAQPLRMWTVPELARETGSSRSALAERFSRGMGESPMHYLRRWRLTLAARRLREGGGPLAALACEYGYSSEAAFSRAFKRQFQSPPAAWACNAASRPDTQASTA